MKINTPTQILSWVSPMAATGTLFLMTTAVHRWWNQYSNSRGTGQPGGISALIRVTKDLRLRQDDCHPTPHALLLEEPAWLNLALPRAVFGSAPVALAVYDQLAFIASRGDAPHFKDVETLRYLTDHMVSPTGKQWIDTYASRAGRRVEVWAPHALALHPSPFQQVADDRALELIDKAHAIIRSGHVVPDHTAVVSVASSLAASVLGEDQLSLELVDATTNSGVIVELSMSLRPDPSAPLSRQLAQQRFIDLKRWATLAQHNDVHQLTRRAADPDRLRAGAMVLAATEWRHSWHADSCSATPNV